MKKSIRAILGVTLLEIMLVLAVAAMVIVLSIRYYQSASSSSQTNAIMGAFQSITAAAGNISQGTGSYSGITKANLTTVVPSATFTSPWGTAMTFSATASSFTVTAPTTPTGVCSLISAKLKGDSHTSASTCTAKGDLVYTYVANP